MLSAIAIVPSAPVLVPELAGAAAVEIADLSAAVSAAAAVLPDSWVALGIGSADAVLGPECTGSFAGFGVDVRAQLGPDGTMPVTMPLCGLIAAWLRGQIRPDGSASVWVCAAGQDSGAAVARGRRLRAEIDRATEPTGVLLVADGVNTLTPRAPGGYDPASTDIQLALDDALAGGDVGALTRLPDQVLGRAAFATLAGLMLTAPRTVKELYRGAPYGVGYFAGVWQP